LDKNDTSHKDVTVHLELPDSTAGYSNAVRSLANMDLSQGIYGVFEATLIVTIIFVIMMAQLAFNYELTGHSNSYTIQIHKLQSWKT
jgi:hypothetical protein